MALAARACAVEIDEVTVADSDVEALRRAVIIALKPDDDTIPIILTLKSWAQMPAYDKAWHYDGLRDAKDFAWGTPPRLAPGEKVMVLSMNADLCAIRPYAGSALTEGFLLALTDDGYGGTALKRLYDFNAAKDARLPPGSADRSISVRRFADELLRLIPPSEATYGAAVDLACRQTS